MQMLFTFKRFESPKMTRRGNTRTSASHNDRMLRLEYEAEKEAVLERVGGSVQPPCKTWGQAPGSFSRRDAWVTETPRSISEIPTS